MEKWKAVGAMVCLLILVAAAAGCSGDAKEEGGGTKAPEYEQVTGTLPIQEGWIESNWETDDGSHAEGSVTLAIPDDNIIGIEVKVTVEDSDAEHTESDEGSDPDTIEVTVTSGSQSAKGKSPTPSTISVSLPERGNATGFDDESGNATFLDGNVMINLEGMTEGGKPYYYGPLEVFTVYVYKDQGFYYKIECSYTYLAEQGFGTEEAV